MKKPLTDDASLLAFPFSSALDSIMVLVCGSCHLANIDHFLLLNHHEINGLESVAASLSITA